MMKTPIFLTPFQQALQAPIKYDHSYEQMPHEALNHLKKLINGTDDFDIIISAWTKMPVDEWEYLVDLLMMELDEQLPYPNI